MRFCFVFPFFVALIFNVSAQNPRDYHRIAFYNVENLFDTIDAPLKADEEFTPDGVKKWNAYRLHSKILRTYKVLIALGEWQLPDVVGFCEVENRYLLKYLLHETPLAKYNYEYLSEDSDDRRGIDVGLIFKKDVFRYECHDLLKVPLERPTRDILYVRGKIKDATYHIYVNHWPSRIGGKEHTEDLRLTASNVLIRHLDSISACEESPKVVIMGDFNDETKDQSLSFLTSHSFTDKIGDEFAITSNSGDSNQGTVTYTTVDTEWFWFDQVLVSSNVKKDKVRIFKPDWLLDGSGKPKRTYMGDYYNNGYSDHLPVFLDIYND